MGSLPQEWARRNRKLIGREIGSQRWAVPSKFRQSGSPDSQDAGEIQHQLTMWWS
jgi:hypothetical protein